MRVFQEIEWEIKSDAYLDPKERDQKQSAKKVWDEIEGNNRLDPADPDDRALLELNERSNST